MPEAPGSEFWRGLKPIVNHRGDDGRAVRSGRRLDCARVDPTATSVAGSRIADIAARWGFASQAHCTRLFRGRFGCTPSEVRPLRAAGLTDG